MKTITKCEECQYSMYYDNNHHCIHEDGNQPLGHNQSIPKWCPLPSNYDENQGEGKDELK